MIPLKDLKTASVYQFHPERLSSVVFHQGKDDGAKHTLIVDDVKMIRMEDWNAHIPDQPMYRVAPNILKATGYERHVLLQWKAEPKDCSYAKVWRAIGNGEFTAIGIMRPGVGMYSDFLGKAGVEARYKVAFVFEGKEEKHTENPQWQPQQLMKCLMTNC